MNRGSVHAQVVAPIPWFPFRAKAFGRYRNFASVPAKEDRFGIDILHPRNDAAIDCILAVQEMVVGKIDEKLAVGRVWVL